MAEVEPCTDGVSGRHEYVVSSEIGINAKLWLEFVMMIGAGRDTRLRQYTFVSVQQITYNLDSCDKLSVRDLTRRNNFMQFWKHDLERKSTVFSNICKRYFRKFLLSWSYSLLVFWLLGLELEAHSVRLMRRTALEKCFERCKCSCELKEQIFSVWVPNMIYNCSYENQLQQTYNESFKTKELQTLVEIELYRMYVWLIINWTCAPACGARTICSFANLSAFEV